MDSSTGVAITRVTNNTFTDRHPAPAPTGNLVAFSSDRDGNFEIYTTSANGLGITRLTTTMALEDRFPVWTVDGASSSPTPPGETTTRPPRSGSASSSSSLVWRGLATGEHSREEPGADARQVVGEPCGGGDAGERMARPVDPRRLVSRRTAASRAASWNGPLAWLPRRARTRKRPAGVAVDRHGWPIAWDLLPGNTARLRRDDQEAARAVPDRARHGSRRSRHDLEGHDRGAPSCQVRRDRCRR